ncbi:hypothetical protein Golomagni_06380 [Golovinomyces magnicellulatus]|nr:hypothetical protein Golomagni_06380 [Golovinomyces magnicellulatus]
MSIPNEALQKLAREIEGQALAAQQQIAIARGQISGKQREQRLVQLTLNEISDLSADATAYEGVGKITASNANVWDRFVELPVTDLRKKLDKQTKDAEADVEKLNQRLLYLETTHKNSREHIEKMLSNK